MLCLAAVWLSVIGATHPSYLSCSSWRRHVCLAGWQLGPLVAYFTMHSSRMTFIYKTLECVTLVNASFSHSCFRYIEGQRPRYITTLREAVGIRSVSAWPEARAEVLRMIQWTGNKLKELGFTIEVRRAGEQVSSMNFTLYFSFLTLFRSMWIKIPTLEICKHFVCIFSFCFPTVSENDWRCWDADTAHPLRIPWWRPE